MKPQTPGMGFFYALILEETGKLYLIARACILKFSESGQARGLERIQKARKAWAPAGCWFLAYTESPKNLDPSRISIRYRPGSREVPGR